MPSTPYRAPAWLPQWRIFNDLPTFAVHAFVRNLPCEYDDDLRADDVMAMTDDEILALRGVGRRSLDVIRSRFPYRGPA